MLRTTLTLLLAFLIVSPAQSGLIQRDLVSAGDGLITYDSQTGLEWLDIDTYQGSSWNTVNNLYSAGGELFGWQHASLSEVDKLYSNAGIYSTRGEQLANSIYSLTDLIGFTAQGGFHLKTFIWAFTGTPEDSRPNPSYWTSLIFMQDTLGTATPEYTFDIRKRFTLEPSRDENTNIGHFLVRTAQVPAPASIWLLLVGLLGLIYRSRLKTT